MLSSTPHSVGNWLVCNSHSTTSERSPPTCSWQPSSWRVYPKTTLKTQAKTCDCHTLKPSARNSSVFQSIRDHSTRSRESRPLLEFSALNARGSRDLRRTSLSGINQPCRDHRRTLSGEVQLNLRVKFCELQLSEGVVRNLGLRRRKFTQLSRPPKAENTVRSALGNDDEYCDRAESQPHGACSFRRSSNPSVREPGNYVEVPDGSDPDQSGYTIKVSKELMGVFRYVEKVKRARIKELANTLRQTAAACMFFSCVRGIVSPLVEVFQTQPPSWGKLVLTLSAFDSFAITYLAVKASEPLEKLSMLASESDKDIMGSIEKEEEHMLALAVELVKLFRRLRNITVCTALAQFVSLAHSMLQMNNPKLLANIVKVVSAWLKSPWVG